LAAVVADEHRGMALVAVWPAHKRWMRAEAKHRVYLARRP
jgi:hypothetical protein